MRPKLENYALMNNNSIINRALVAKKRYLVCLVAALVCSASAWAVVASPVPFEYTKPDGTVVMARVYGDEFHSYIESLDGELLYGSRDEEALEEAAQIRRIRRAHQGAGDMSFPTKGSPHSLVLLVSFSDLDMGESLQNFKDLLNKSGYNYNGATGSCRDFYIASSDSIFLPEFDCFGPYKMPKSMEYYGGNSGNSNSQNAHEMVAEACQMAHNAGVNFKNYDTNNDGLLDNVFIFYAGHNEAEGGPAASIWPHQSNISSMGVRLDGVLVASYACTSEYKGSNGSVRCGIGTFCHEFGHVIGQPDFYDTDYNYYSVGNWDVMCDGSYNNDGNTPPTFSAYERMYEGWLTPKQLLLPGQYSLSDIPFHKEAYLIAASTHNLSGTNPNPSEFFLLDNRSGDNGWDKYLPGNGMLVWHIDYSASAWTSNTPNNGPTLMRMHLEEANGVTWQKRANREKGRSSDPYPGTNNVTSFSPALHNNTQLNQPVFNIKEVGSVITFTYIGDGVSSLRADKDIIELVTTVDDDKKIKDWDPQEFTILGTGLDPEKNIVLSSNNNLFTLFAGEEAPNRTNKQWSRSVSLKASNDSTLEQKIWVNFRPTKRDCEETTGVISITSEMASSAVSLIGYAPRPTYVTQPETLPSSDITPYSFTAHWKNQEDAELYYLTLYKAEEGTTDFVQGFENFSDFVKIREEGWQSSTNLITTSAKSEGTCALYLKTHGDQVTSETYPAAVTNLSFWYNAFTSSLDTIGVLTIEAYDGKEWIVMDNLLMTNKSKRVTANYPIEAESNYRAFRMTWIDNGGAGIALDAFTTTLSEKITYLKKGKEIAIQSYSYGEEAFYTFGGLQPDSVYYYQVQTTDSGKGCEEHVTELSDPSGIRTLSGKPSDDKQLTFALDSINYNPALYTVYLTNPQEGDYLYFYNYNGNLVQSTSVKANTYSYPLEKDNYRKGEIYMIQHAVAGKLKRKQKWVKFMFQ